MIDLHTHTTASDGRCTPAELVDRAVTAGVTVLGVADHDTMDGVAGVQAAAARRGVEVVPGIEITAVESARDVHVLGYFLDAANAPLNGFLQTQRATRVARLQAIGERLASLGMPVDLTPLLEEARRETGRSLGRPRVARLLIDAGYVADTREAFERWLGTGCPAFVERTGASVVDVIAIVHAAGGLASLAHPGRTRLDARIDAFAEAGLDALEVYHSDHDAEAVARYRLTAGRLGLLVTGGSDFHGDPTHGFEPGVATLPEDEWQRLRAARHRHAAR